MPRPKLDPTLTQRLVDLIRAGNYLEVAATAAGIHRSTLHRWMRHGRAQKRGRYRKFLSAVEKAQAESESRDVAIIAKAASDDWKAAAWRLERKQPRHYGPRVAVSTPEERRKDDQDMLRRMEGRLAPEFYAQVADLIADSDEDWGTLVKRVLGKERHLDICEAEMELYVEERDAQGASS